ncbi:hypothetical protein BaRGS_00016713 [Batillaria attramentaria]|uniref:Uncharacterized protein n=1 Tax=Batillaria attramentaria TaxID=370345 RepID=A0ABD0KY01_9CAEN
MTQAAPRGDINDENEAERAGDEHSIQHHCPASVYTGHVPPPLPPFFQGGARSTLSRTRLLAVVLDFRKGLIVVAFPNTRYRRRRGTPNTVRA